MADSFSIKFYSAGLTEELNKLANSADANVRAAAQAGAQVLYEEVRQRTPVSKRARKTKYGRIIKPGALKASIYQVYSESKSNPKRAEYHISWNHIKAPHGHLVEFGTSRAAAHPFLRPAFDARGTDALKAAKVRFTSDMSKSISAMKK